MMAVANMAHQGIGEIVRPGGIQAPLDVNEQVAASYLMGQLHGHSYGFLGVYEVASSVTDSGRVSRYFCASW